MPSDRPATSRERISTGSSIRRDYPATRRELDIWRLWSLGDGAVPDMVARLDGLPTKERIAVVELRRTSLRWRNVDGETDWRGVNVDRARAARL